MNDFFDLENFDSEKVNAGKKCNAVNHLSATPITLKVGVSHYIIMRDVT